MLTQNSKKKVKKIDIPDSEKFFKEVEPVIKKCISEHPTYPKEVKQEMYDVAVAAVLDNYRYYDPNKGNPLFFYFHIRGAIDQYIAKEINSFSSYEKFRDYRQIQRIIPNIDSVTLTDEDYKQIHDATGLGKRAVNSAIRDAKIGLTSSIDAMDYLEIMSTDLPLEEQVMQTEMQNAVRKAMEGLTEKEHAFVYDMFGFEGREILTKNQLQLKYSLSSAEFTSFANGIKRKLLSSRTLRRYLGRHTVFLDCRVV